MNKEKIDKIVSEAVKLYFDYPNLKIAQVILRAKEVIN